MHQINAHDYQGELTKLNLSLEYRKHEERNILL